MFDIALRVYIEIETDTATGIESSSFSGYLPGPSISQAPVFVQGTLLAAGLILGVVESARRTMAGLVLRIKTEADGAPG